MIRPVEKVLFAWSSGKDSALALYEIKRTQQYEISSLLTTTTDEYDRISMHGVRTTLLEQQAQSLGLPLEKVSISKNVTDEEYQSRMATTLANFRDNGVSSVVYGDIFLEGVRKYREEQLSKVGMRGLFPLWGRNSANLSKTLIDLGFKAIVTCVDSRVIDSSFVGRLIDESFLAEIPSSVDPNGENGEFHSFVFEGPIFRESIPYIKGEVVKRDSFYFCDLLPGS